MAAASADAQITDCPEKDERRRDDVCETVHEMKALFPLRHLHRYSRVLLLMLFQQRFATATTTETMTKYLAAAVDDGCR